MFEVGGRRSKVDTWWWNEETKKAVSRKKETHKAICQNSMENKRYKSLKNKEKKAASKAMREKVEEALTEQKNCTNWMLRLV